MPAASGKKSAYRLRLHFGAALRHRLRHRPENLPPALAATAGRRRLLLTPQRKLLRLTASSASRSRFVRVIPADSGLTTTKSALRAAVNSQSARRDWHSVGSTWSLSSFTW